MVSKFNTSLKIRNDNCSLGANRQDDEQRLTIKPGETVLLRPKGSRISASAVAANSTSRSSLKLSIPELEDAEFDDEKESDIVVDLAKQEETVALQKQIRLTKVNIACMIN